MSAIRGRGTKPELRVRTALKRAGLRLADTSARRLPGRPDALVPSRRSAVFVHGCFWHRHPGCRFATTPSTNVAFWREKFDANVRRDARVARALRKAGWRVHVVWACRIDDAALARLVARVTGKPVATIRRRF